MAGKTLAERLFGAACVRVALEGSKGEGPASSEVYKGVLADLGISEDEVEEFLGDPENRARVREAMKNARNTKH